MDKELIIKSYYGGLAYLEKNSNKKLIIFVVDDSEMYTKMLQEKLSANKNFSVYTFNTGESALDYIELNPDFVILDYHLDGVYSYAKKGDVISELIKERSPKTEVLLVSADHKLSFLSGLGKCKKKVMFKKNIKQQQLQDKSLHLFSKKRRTQVLSKVALIFIALVALITYNIS